MEPASVFTHMALAAATLAPAPPQLEVTLRDWQNNKGAPMDIYQGNPSQYTRIGQLMDGYNEKPIPITFDSKSNYGFTFTYIRLLPWYSSLDYIEIILDGASWDKKTSLLVSCSAHHRESSTEVRGLGICSENVCWEAMNPPKFIALEIGGTIGMNWNDAQIAIQKNLGMLEKIH